MSLLFNTLSRFVIAILPRSKWLLISWLQSSLVLILEPKKMKLDAVSFSPSFCHEVMGPDSMVLVFWMLSFKSAFQSPLSPSSRGSLVPLYFLTLKCYHLLLDSMGEGKGGMIWEKQHRNMYIIKCETDHQSRLDAWYKCSGLVHWDDPEGWDGEGGRRGVQDGNTCKSMADSCQCMAKTTTIL